jgi:hypothetical protein
MTFDPRDPQVDQERLSGISLLFLAFRTEDLAMPVEELDSILLFTFLQIDVQHGVSDGVRDGADFGQEFFLLLVLLRLILSQHHDHRVVLLGPHPS